jgi:hypothetical protein
MPIVGTTLAPLPSTAKLLDQKVTPAQAPSTSNFGIGTSAQTASRYSLNGGSQADVFEIDTPTKKVRVVIDPQAKTREEFTALNMSQFGQADLITGYSKESFAGGYNVYSESNVGGSFRSANTSIQDNALHTARSDGTTSDEPFSVMSPQEFTTAREQLDLGDPGGFSLE